MAHDPNHPVHSGPAYETRDVQLGPLLKLTLWTGVVVVATLAAMYGTLRGFQELPAVADNTERSPMLPAVEIPPGPHLESLRGVQMNLAGELATSEETRGFTTRMWRDLRDESKQRLSSYGWVDQQIGVVHIPIERAMELVLKDGFPSREPTRN
jgi:hypothetical protein